MKRIIIGQILLIICCVLYLTFWSLGYKPGADGERFKALTMIFLVLTAFSGIVGTESTIVGMNAISKVRDPVLPGWVICTAGIVLYLLLLLVTGKILHWPVTTELLLITGCLVLESCMINSLVAAGTPKNRTVVMLIIVLAAWLISMVLYMLYYRMNEQKAYYAAMVPLITEAAGMAGCLFCMIR